MEYLSTNKEINKITPVVSVSIPTYQHAKFIRQAIESVLMQETNFPFEIIIGEDGSTDGTREICLDYASKYPDKIRLFLRSREDVIYINGLPSGRFNFIENIKAARGKYIALLDGDDYWTDPLKLQKQVLALEENQEAVIAFHDTFVISEKGENIKESKLSDVSKRNLNREAVVGGTFIPTNTIMFRNNIIVNFPPEMNRVVNGDTFLFALLGQYGEAIFLKSIRPSAYRKHSGGIWSAASNMRRVKGRLETYEALHRLVDYKFKRSICKRIFINMIIYALAQEKFGDKISHYLKAFRYFILDKELIKQFLAITLTSIMKSKNGRKV